MGINSYASRRGHNRFTRAPRPRSHEQVCLVPSALDSDDSTCTGFLGPAFLNNWLVRMESDQLNNENRVIAESQSREAALDPEKS